MIDVLVSPSAVVTECYEDVSLDSDWEFVEPQSFSFSKKRSVVWEENRGEMSYEGTPVKAPPNTRRRMMPPMPQQSSHSSTDETQWQAEMEAIAHMFSSLDFETQWTTVAAALVHQKLSLPCRR